MQSARVWNDHHEAVEPSVSGQTTLRTNKGGQERVSDAG